MYFPTTDAAFHLGYRGHVNTKTNHREYIPQSEHSEMIFDVMINILDINQTMQTNTAMRHFKRLAPLFKQHDSSLPNMRWNHRHSSLLFSLDYEGANSLTSLFCLSLFLAAPEMKNDPPLRRWQAWVGDGIARVRNIDRKTKSVQRKATARGRKQGKRLKLEESMRHHFYSLEILVSVIWTKGVIRWWWAFIYTAVSPETRLSCWQVSSAIGVWKGQMKENTKKKGMSIKMIKVTLWRSVDFAAIVIIIIIIIIIVIYYALYPKLFTNHILWPL